MALAEEALEAKDLSGTLDILANVPSQANLQKEVRDFRIIARAQSRTWTGSVADIQAAISELRKIAVDRPYYSKAQELVTRWQTDIADIARLEKAEALATRGNVPSLMAAIAEASQVPQSNPRWENAQALIGRWTATVQTQEDQPLLDRAEQFALAATPEAYQAAIAEAGRIGKGRALYDSAQERMGTWRGKLEWLQDQPILAQARSLAASGNLTGAIATAKQISAGRALHSEAQGAIAGWQKQVDAENSLVVARRYAQDGWNSGALVQAIEAADRVPTDSNLRYDANLEIATWSNRLLQIAIEQANSDLYQAIDTASLVPSWTDAYGAAQARIRSWDAMLQPAAPVYEPEPAFRPAAPQPAPEPELEAEPEPTRGAGGQQPRLPVDEIPVSPPLPESAQP